MRRLLATIAVLALLLTTATAQISQVPQLTHVERLQWHLLQLEVALAQAKADAARCIGQLGQATAVIDSASLTDKEAMLKRQIESTRPGYAWNPKTGAFTEAK